MSSIGSVSPASLSNVATPFDMTVSTVSPTNSLVEVRGENGLLVPTSSGTNPTEASAGTAVIHISSLIGDHGAAYAGGGVVISSASAGIAYDGTPVYATDGGTNTTSVTSPSFNVTSGSDVIVVYFQTADNFATGSTPTCTGNGTAAGLSFSAIVSEYQTDTTDGQPGVVAFRAHASSGITGGTVTASFGTRGAWLPKGILVFCVSGASATTGTTGHSFVSATTGPCHLGSLTPTAATGSWLFAAASPNTATGPTYLSGSTAVTAAANLTQAGGYACWAVVNNAVTTAGAPYDMGTSAPNCDFAIIAFEIQAA